MHYLYGDSTPSQLTTNFLEFLRDAIDFAVVVLQADHGIKVGKARARALQGEAEAELQRLEGFIYAMTESVNDADKGEPESPTARCAAALLDLIDESHKRAAAGINQRLAADLAAIDEEEAAARDRSVKALEALLLPHDPPDAVAHTAVTLVEGAGKYAASATGQAGFGLEWTIELAIPDTNLWASTITVGRIAPQLEIRVPQLTGWISKEVKIKPLKIDRHVVTELVDDGRLLRLRLRAEPGSASGFDLDVDAGSEAMRAVRVGAADDPSTGPFELAPEDAAALLDIVKKLRAAAGEFVRRALVAARSGGYEFRAQPVFGDVVQRLVAMMSPIVQEISERSLTPNELIIRRPLSNDRREEIYVSKSTLRDKYSLLPDDLRAVFTPLGLDDPERVKAARGKPKSVPPPLPPPPSSRSELPPSNPPGPPPPAPPPPSAPAPPVAAPPISAPPPSPFLPAASSPGSAPPSGELPPVVAPPPRSVTPPTSPSTLPPAGSFGASWSTRPPNVIPRTPSPPTAVPKGPPPPKMPPPRSVSPAKPPSVAPPPLPSQPPPAAPEDPNASSSPSFFPPPNDGQKNNEELITTLKRIRGLVRSGSFAEAHREYAMLFSSFEFAQYRPDEQRQAIRLMVVPKTKPPITDEVIEAHRVALERLKILTESTTDAADYELLGATYVVLDDLESARLAFTTGLALERARDPGSELVGTLMKRVSEI